MTGSESQPGEGRRDDRKPVGTLINELAGLVISYVKQETVVPIKSLGRFVAFGVAGAVLVAIGGGLLTLAAVRAVQSETGRHLAGNLTWVPYVGGILLAGIGAGWAITRIGKRPAHK
jgi:hypothetical protein